MTRLWLIASLLGCVGADAVGQSKRLPVQNKAIESTAVGRQLNYSVIVPERYGEDKDRRYPVLYLLHGYGGNYTEWARLGTPTYAAHYELIVVAVDGGNSWYVNWAESDDGESNAWEDYIVKELVPAVDAEFRTIASREGRAISGLSMGGFGALTIGLRHPDMFASIGSLSGALAVARDAGKRIAAGEPLPERDRSPEAMKRFREPNPDIDTKGFRSSEERTPNGRAFVTVRDARAYDPFRLIVHASPTTLPAIYLDCGTEDRLIDANKDFAGVLLRNDIRFTYHQSAGGHDSVFWIEALGRAMAVQYEALMRELGRRPMAGRRESR